VAHCVEAIEHGQYPVTVSGRGKHLGAAGVEWSEAAKRFLFGLAARYAACHEVVDPMSEVRENLVVGLALDAAMLVHGR
jgi:hypothetical protein